MKLTETQLLRDIRRELNATGLVRLVRNNSGVDTTRGVRYGLGVGGPDLVGMLRGGRAFCIEVKRPGESLRTEQRRWWSAYIRWGGLGGVAHSVDEAITYLRLAR